MGESTKPTALWSSDDLKKVSGSIAIFILLSAIGSLFLYWIENQSRIGKKTLLDATARFEEAEKKLRQVNQEETEIREKSRVFQRLSARKIITRKEDRLAWIELLDTVQLRHHLFSPEYEFKPMQPLGPALANYQLNTTPMSFSLPMLHEGDLINFTSGLRQQASALVLPRDCTIERLGDQAPQKHGLFPKLKAVCQSSWITLQVSEK